MTTDISQEIIERALIISDQSINLTQAILENKISNGHASSASRSATNSIAALAMAWRGANTVPMDLELKKAKMIGEENHD